MTNELYFASWGWLFLLILIPMLIVLRYIFYKKHKGRFAFSNVFLIRLLNAEVSFLKKHSLFILNLLILLCLILGMARLQGGEPKRTDTSIRGMDIVLLLDVSGSMNYVDGDPQELGMQAVSDGFNRYYKDRYGLAKTRIESAKEVLTDFIKRRTNDRLGLVAFSDVAMRLVPLTTSKVSLTEELDKVDFKYLGAAGGTAIGKGIGLAMAALEHSKAKSKIIILLTDGNSNTGRNPEEVAKEAVEREIKIYTIGLGDKANVLVEIEQKGIYAQVPNQQREPLQEDVLTRIAESTHAEYFRAANKDDLLRVYDKIDSLEKSIIDSRIVRTKTTEWFWIFLILALGFLAMEFILRHTWLRTIP